MCKLLVLQEYGHTDPVSVDFGSMGPIVPHHLLCSFRMLHFQKSLQEVQVVNSSLSLMAILSALIITKAVLSLMFHFITNWQHFWWGVIFFAVKQTSTRLLTMICIMRKLGRNVFTQHVWHIIIIIIINLHHFCFYFGFLHYLPLYCFWVFCSTAQAQKILPSQTGLHLCNFQMAGSPDELLYVALKENTEQYIHYVNIHVILRTFCTIRKKQTNKHWNQFKHL